MTNGTTYQEGVFMEFKKLEVVDLLLDLDNFRTLPQKNEKDAIDTMISISPDNYWALFTSIIDNGYFETENLIVLNKNGNYIVKEGNRRISVLKLIYGLIPGFNLDVFYISKIKSLSNEWLTENTKIPCIIYDMSEMDKLNLQISLIHGKDEKAGRDRWSSMARARFARDVHGKDELGLDLIDKYFDNNFEISDNQKKKWSGTFPLTILNDALPKIVSVLNCETVKSLVDNYPLNNKSLIDSIVFDIGNGLLDFKEVRSESFLKNDKYHQKINCETIENSSLDNLKEKNPVFEKNEFSNNSKESNNSSRTKSERKKCSYGLADWHSVRKVLRSFKPHGVGNEKIVTLKDEMLQLDISKNPLAFSFLLRSMIEISLKSYAENNSAAFELFENKEKNRDRPLKKIVNDAIIFFEKIDVSNQKKLYPAKSTLSNDNSILSVTSLNQLIHNPKYSLSSTDICVGFHNIFPLIELLNS